MLIILSLFTRIYPYFFVSLSFSLLFFFSLLWKCPAWLNNNMKCQKIKELFPWQKPSAYGRQLTALHMVLERFQIVSLLSPCLLSLSLSLSSFLPVLKRKDFSTSDITFCLLWRVKPIVMFMNNKINSTSSLLPLFYRLNVLLPFLSNTEDEHWKCF